jgi:hypothetical protein
MFNKSEIKEHMEVLGSDGQHVGKVDHLEGSSDIKLGSTTWTSTSISTERARTFSSSGRLRPREVPQC